MLECVDPLLDSARLLFDLQSVNKIAQSISGCLEPDAIAGRVTDALVEHFDCVFARIWLLEPDQVTLRLVASSGLYTHTDGSFARVPMGAYKVGKIAQNRVPFLSNHLADELWVKDREWAIANQIQGFAGYPLVVGDRVIGVLATFSRQAMAPEFLEVLQVLCMTATIALDAALQVQASPSTRLGGTPGGAGALAALSDQLASVLTNTRFMLVGTERSLTASVGYVLLKSAEILNQLECSYCRLMYGAQAVSLEAIVAVPPLDLPELNLWQRSQFDEIRFLALCLKGHVHTQTSQHHRMVQFLLELPYPVCHQGAKVRVDCQFFVLQTALTHLAYAAGLTLCDAADPEAVLLTDTPEKLRAESKGIWIRSTRTSPVPGEAMAVIDFPIEPAQLQGIVEQVFYGASLMPATGELQRLSDREQEVMRLLSEGLRDRDIAQHLFISESTVKFHINNSLAKLNAKNRYQGVYRAAIHGWI